MRCFLVKPSDVAIYVEHGAADLGIAGKDILAESEADVYELLDTGLGRCRMCVAGPAGFREDPGRPLRVATKFPRIAKEYYASQGRDIEIIKLNGSIELAPILGLSDVIVDIVETGATLRENGLAVLAEFMPISARVVANKASYQFKRREADRLLGPPAGGAGPKGGRNVMMKLYRLEDLTPGQVLNRDLRAEQDVEAVVDAIIADVRARGDAALRDYAPQVRRGRAGRAGSVPPGAGRSPGRRRPLLFGDAADGGGQHRGLPPPPAARQLCDDRAGRG